MSKDTTIGVTSITKKPHLRLVKDDEEFIDGSYRILTWENIKKITSVAKRKNYNRRVDIKKLKAFLIKSIAEDGYGALEKTRFPARPLMVHKYAQGVECTPHMRIYIRYGYLEGCTFIIDCDMKLWESFPVYKKLEPVEVLRDEHI
jgi:hypothetical protein